MSDWSWFWIAACVLGVAGIIGGTMDDIYTHPSVVQTPPACYHDCSDNKIPPYTEAGHVTCIYQGGISSLEADGHSYTPPREVLQCDNGYDYPTDLGSKI